MALVPPSLWLQSGTVCQSFLMLDEGFWAQIRVGGEHLRLAAARAEAYLKQIANLELPTLMWKRSRSA